MVFLLFLALVVAVPLLIIDSPRAWQTAAKVRDLRRAVYIERNRNRFGELRTELVRAVKDDLVRADSPHFAALYMPLTVLMRNPHCYDDAAGRVLSLEPSSLPRPAGQRETDFEAKLYMDFARAMDLMLRDYSWYYRMMAGLIERLAPNDGSPLARLASLPMWLQVYVLRGALMRAGAASIRLASIGQDLRMPGALVASPLH